MRCRHPLVPGLVFAGAVLALLAAGCGGGGSPGVASVASSTSTATSAGQPGLRAYAACMRAHGVPGFPDPDSSGGIDKSQIVAAAQRNRSRFGTASTACGHLRPSGGLAPPQTAGQQRIRLADELSFARCMRSHGIRNFPDPAAQGGLSVEMVEARGIDVHSPAVLRVVQECLPASHGELTMRKVREAIDHAG